MNLPFKISEEKQKEIDNLIFIPKGNSKFEIGDVYNHLTILGRAKNAEGYRNTYVYAICDCPQHNIIKVQLNKLKNNNTISCGCEHKKITAELGKKSYINMLDSIVGSFKIIEKTEERNSESVVWLGECVYCGEKRKIAQRNMRDNIMHPNICSCQRRGGSSLEQKVEQILDYYNIHYNKEKIFQNFIYEDTKCHPRFDFYLSEYNCLIEVNGKQHYICSSGFMEKDFKKRQLRDKIKINWALNNNYNIIIIPYDIINNITISDLLPNTSKYLVKEEVS